MINIDVIMIRIKDKNTYRNFCEFIIGMLITSVAVSVFYKPNNLVTTGCTGLSIIIANYINVDLSLIVFSLFSKSSSTKSLKTLEKETTLLATLFLIFPVLMSKG